MKMNNLVGKIALAVVVSALAAFNAGAIVAYNDAAINTPTTTPGNQVLTAMDLGQAFTVNSPITVGYLGAFDAGQNGWAGATITVAIYNFSTHQMVGSDALFSGTGATEGVLGANSSFRFLAVTPFTLAAGQTYEIVASGLGTAANPDYNSATSPGNVSLMTLNTFGGALTYGGNYYNYPGNGTMPTHLDVVPVPGPGRYGAGTFAPVPEVGLFGIAGVGLLGLVYIGRGLVLRRRLAGV
jgi:hypothetical protein